MSGTSHSDRSSREQAVSLYTRLIDAWNRRSAADFAALLTLLRAVVGMVSPGQTELNPAVNALQSVVMVEQEGELRISLLHNTPAAFHGRPHLVERLTEELIGVLRSGHMVQVG